MSRQEVDDLLVEWELARQQGRDLEAAALCQDNPHLEPMVKRGIHILRQTSWMLDDPAPEPFAPAVRHSVSRITLDGDALGMQSSVRESASDAEVSAEKAQHFDSPSPKRSFPQIAGFEIEQELGRGGFGVVYRARDLKLERDVAIKLPLLDNPTQRERYLREARHAARVEVPGIVPVLQVGTLESGLPFVVQKLIDGKSLAEVLSAGGRLSPSQTAELLVDVCKAIGTAHTQSLVHRDLKPANILMDGCGKPWVTDFGLAVSEDDQMEKKGEVAGTLSYMSPEQLRGKVDWFDGRTDLWAVGVIMYEALTGKLPFQASNHAELREQVLRREPRPICQRMPLLPKKWDSVFRRCCAKSIQDRYDSAFEMASHLLELRNSSDVESDGWFNPLLSDLQRSKDPLTVVDPQHIQASSQTQCAEILSGTRLPTGSSYE